MTVFTLRSIEPDAKSPETFNQRVIEEFKNAEEQIQRMQFNYDDQIDRMLGRLNEIEESDGTWQPNTVDQEGYVTAGGGHLRKVWKTDEYGNPAWREDDEADVDSITNDEINAMFAFEI